MLCSYHKRQDNLNTEEISAMSKLFCYVMCGKFPKNIELYFKFRFHNHDITRYFFFKMRHENVFHVVCKCLDLVK